MGIAMVMITPAGRECQHQVGMFSPSTFSLGGSISINSSNPFDPPLIDPGIVASDFDLFTLREALKRAQKFVSAPVWKNYIIASTEDLENIPSEALDEHIRNSAFAGLHMVGSAGMSARNAGYGVVDPDLLVKGVSGLRIIDASVIVRDLFKFKRIWYSHLLAHCAGCTHSGRSICICGEGLGLDQGELAVARNLGLPFSFETRKRVTEVQIGFRTFPIHGLCMSGVVYNHRVMVEPKDIEHSRRVLGIGCSGRIETGDGEVMILWNY
jgi:hypothetical protein